MSILDAFGGKQSPMDLSSLSFQQKMAEFEQQQKMQQQPSQQGQQSQQAKSPSFDRLEDFGRGFSQDKNEWINSQTNVKEKRVTMMAAFDDYIWANMYKQFDTYCEENNLPYCKDYVDSFVEQTKTYKSPIDQQNQTIETQNSTIAELKRQVDALTKKGGDLL